MSEVTTVTSENLEQFNQSGGKLPIEPEVIEGELVEAPEEEAGETTDSEAQPDEAEEVEEEEKKPKKKNSFQERISEVTAEKNAAKEEAARLRRELEEYRKQKPAEPEIQTPSPDERPRPEDYKEWADYVEALSDWKVEQKFKQQDEQRAQREVQQSWKARVDAAKTEMPDYDEVIQNSNLEVHSTVREAILESELGPKIAYHLATHPDVTESLKKLSIPSQLRELGKIEASLTKPIIEKPAVKVSQAPAPISPIKSSTATDLNDDDLSFEDFKAARLAGKIK